MIRGPARNEQGFALIEALIAAALFAGMTALLFQTVTSTLSAKRHVAESRRATLVAQSALAEFQDSRMRPTIAQTGQDGPFSWRAQIAPYSGAATENSRGLEQLTITVSHTQTRRTITSLTTLRLARR